MNSCSRRSFLQTLGGAGAFCAVPSIARGASLLNPDTVTVSILHTTDLHGHILPLTDYDGTPDVGGLARCVTQIRRWRRKNRNTILLDIGDVYQGTDVGLRSKGQLMIDLFNHLRYDAWVIGNHEFDWGMEAFLRTVQASHMPVLAANTVLEGKPAGESHDHKNPFARVRPYIIKEIEGIRVAIVGVTTPGMPFWFRPENIRGLDFQYPVEPVRRAIAQAKGEGAHAIVLAGHMGLKLRLGGDDFANNVMSLTSEFPSVVAFLGGHTHQNIPSRMTNGVLFTQANHYGIHAGRLDLVFDRNSKRLVHRQARCEYMDNRFRLDHIVLARAKSQLDESEAALSTPIGELAEALSVKDDHGNPSDVERLIGAAMIESLQERGTQVDGALHGLFDDQNDIPPGPKTVADVWKIIPYENYLVTAELTHDEMQAVMDETFATNERRSLLGFNVQTTGEGVQRKVTSLTLPNGQLLERDRRYVIALNTFDSRSAGHRFMKLRAMLESAAARTCPHDVQTRDALIDYFRPPSGRAQDSADDVARRRLTKEISSCKRRCLRLRMCPVRSLALFSTALLFAGICLAQSIDVQSTRSDQVPMYRPALVGSAPDALINRIDENDLVAKGQKAAIVMFACKVERTGAVQWASYYGATADAGPLLEEITYKMPESKFIPAIYNRVPVDVVFFGTVSFAVVDGKPRLRIFSNQEKEELRKESDFISPQPFFGKDSKFEGWHYPSQTTVVVAVKATVDLELEVDEQGLLSVISVVSEEPPLLGFAKLAAEDTAKARFIPAFRGGKPVASKTTMHLNFSPPSG